MHPKAVKQLISGPVGPLESRILENDPDRWAVLCHPHPLYGGSMDNKVITTVERALQQKGWSTLCFNFRGVGESAGSFDQGIGEQADLQAVVAWLKAHYGESDWLLGGFSFGAYVSLKSWKMLNPSSLLSIAPPVELWDFSEIATPTVPWVVIQGGADEVVAPEAVAQWLVQQHPYPTVYWRAGVSHFFHRQLIWLREVIKLEYYKKLI